jgi:two-component system chemotaxis sensor kinase CheA
MVGQETAVDKYVIERLKEPFLHLVRNAISHGVETPAERVAASKPEEATIELRAETSGDSVILRVRDDGRGVDAEAIMEKAQQLGLKTNAQAGILDVLCSPGFSTREKADRGSGRGVGMAVVYSTIRELGGKLSLESAKGRGSSFILRIPLTMAVAESFIISTSEQTYALPQKYITAVLRVTAKQVQIIDGIEAIPYQSGVLPLVRLADVLGLSATSSPNLCIVVIATERGSVGLVAERILGQREIVVHPLKDPLLQVPGISGVSEFGDGKPILILDAPALMGKHVRLPEQVTANGDMATASLAS